VRKTAGVRFKLPGFLRRRAGNGDSGSQPEGGSAGPTAEGAPAQAPVAPTPKPGGAEEPAATAVTDQPGTDTTIRLGPLDLDLPSRRRKRVATALALVAAASLGAAAGFAAAELLGDDDAGPAPAPTVTISEAPEAEAAEEIGFPAFATRNTTRVGGGDPIADAAGVALASYPSTGGVAGPPAVVLAPAGSWEASLAASSLAADPIGAVILLGEPDEVPGFTAEALNGLSIEGLGDAGDVQLIAIGDVALPDGLETITIDGSDPTELAQAIDRERGRLGGEREPEHILVVPLERPEIAMPAAAWAARSGDPIVFASADEAPDATLAVIERHEDTPIYVLGDNQAISASVVSELDEAGGRVRRIGRADPVENAIAFARYSDRSFGWSINDPGHGLIVASTASPLDAPAAAPLAAGGKPGPLLLTDDPDRLPGALRGFLLDTKPGFLDDPARAVFNHIWVIGDDEAISVEQQAQIDELTKLVPVDTGRGGIRFDDEDRPRATPGRPERGSGDLGQ
jgi:hypothetical protein